MPTKPVLSHMVRLSERSPSSLTGFLKTANFTVTQGDVFVGDTSGGSITATLPLAAQNRARMLIFVKKVAANTYTIQRAGADTITFAGSTSINLATRDAVALLLSDGTSVWMRIV